jgi:hypothetical protein
MARLQTEVRMGDVTHNPQENRVRLRGAYGAAPTFRRTFTTLPRPAKKHDGGCKTCDGLNCVGKCRF